MSPGCTKFVETDREILLRLLNIARSNCKTIQIFWNALSSRMFEALHYKGR